MQTPQWTPLSQSNSSRRRLWRSGRLPHTLPTVTNLSRGSNSSRSIQTTLQIWQTTMAASHQQNGSDMGRYQCRGKGLSLWSRRTCLICRMLSIRRGWGWRCLILISILRGELGGGRRLTCTRWHTWWGSLGGMSCGR